MTFRRLGFTVLLAVALPATLVGQVRAPGSIANRAPEKDAAHVMITSFKTSERMRAGTAPDKILSYQAADEMRKKVNEAFPSRQLYVIPVDRINANLGPSNFPIAEGLELADARALASITRADEFIAGSATKTATGYKVEADLILTRDVNARQPLGVGEAPKLGDAVNLLVKEYREARKQLDGEKKCVNAAREQKWTEAVQFANAAITAYPNATLARACLLNALYASKAPTTDVTKVAKALVAIDSRSNTGLRFILDAYDKAGPSMSDSLVLTLLTMMRNDPKNTDFQAEAIKRIAAATNPGIARPIIDSAVAQNPNDTELLRLRWQILYATKDYKAMFEQGNELVRLDTAFADTTYFTRTANAYQLDSAWQQAAATLAQGTTKFPTNAFLVGFEAQMLQKSGQLQQALDKLHKAEADKVAVPDAGTIELQILRDMKAPSAQLVLRAKELIARGDTTTNIRQSLLNELQTQVKFGTDLMKTDAAAAIDSLNATITAFKESDPLAKNPLQKAQIAFLSGMANTTLASIKAQQAGASKSCQLAKAARVNATAAMTSLPQGAAFAPPATVNAALANAMQIDSYAEQLMKSFPACK